MTPLFVTSGGCEVVSESCVHRVARQIIGELILYYNSISYMRDGLDKLRADTTYFLFLIVLHIISSLQSQEAGFLLVQVGRQRKKVREHRRNQNTFGGGEGGICKIMKQTKAQN